MGASGKEGTMEEVASTARLVDTVAPGDGHALTATIPRSQVAAALEEGGSADLILNVARMHDGDRENRTATISWERPDLEELLRRASGDQIELTFDQAELERMLDADVEAHGFREKALVLTVAAATAAGLAGQASAKVMLDGGSSQSAPIASLAPDTSAQPDGWLAGAVTDNAAQNVGQPDGWLAGATDAAEPSVASNVITDRGSDPTRIPAEPSVASNVITDRGSDPARIPAEPSSTGGGFSVPDSAVDAALAGGLALLITGAAFVTRAQRRREQPA
jgi:hypothetical protein